MNLYCFTMYVLEKKFTYVVLRASILALISGVLFTSSIGNKERTEIERTISLHQYLHIKTIDAVLIQAPFKIVYNRKTLCPKRISTISSSF